MLADIRYAFRTLLKSPGFLAVAVITLALGIGANTAMFSVVKAVLLSQLPYPQPDRLVQLWEARKDGGLMWVSGPNAQDWESQNRSMQWMARTESDTATLVGANVPVRVRMTQVSRGFFPLFEVQPEIGRATQPADHREGAAPVIVIGHALWQRAFGGDPKALGSTVRLNGQAFTVIGAMPAGFDFPEKTEVWMPHEIFPDRSTRSAHNFHVYGRLKPDVALPAAQADMDTIASRLGRAYTDDHDRGIRVVSLYEQIVGPVRPALLILLAAVGFVLLIACVNVANLQLSRASLRVREMALRGALGATRPRLIRQLLTEAVLIALMGGSAGLLLALWGAEFLRASIPPNIPRIGTLQIDVRVLLFALALSLSAGIVFGLIPALLGSSTNVIEALKEGSSKTTMSVSQRRWGGALVVSEIAIAMVLLAGAGLLIQTFRNLENVDPGFAVKGVISAEVSWPVGPAESDQLRAGELTRRMLDKVRSIRGIESAGVINSFPIKESGADGGFEIAGRPLPSDPHQVPDALYRVADRGYFEAMKIPLQRGRLFSEADERPDAPQVALVNQAFVKEFFPQSEPIGQRIRFFGFDEKPQFMQIVGVVKDVRSVGLRRPAASEVFASGFQHPGDLSSPTLAARGSLSAVPQIREAIRATDPNVPVEFQSVTELLAASVSREQFQMKLIGLFAALALVLAAIGIYGVQAHAVSRRTGELGIRVALGAGRGHVLRLVLREALGVTALGVATGLAGAFLLTRTLSSFLYGVSPVDPFVFTAIACLLVAAALLASWIPARRASRIDPLVALRYE
jgi:putative ABC transport system permease protein